MTPFDEHIFNTKQKLIDKAMATRHDVFECGFRSAFVRILFSLFFFSFLFLELMMILKSENRYDLPNKDASDEDITTKMWIPILFSFRIQFHSDPFRSHISFRVDIKTPLFVELIPGVQSRGTI